MYILISFAIPIITILIMLAFFHKKVLIGQYALILGPSVLFGILLNFIMIAYNTSKTEYLGYYITHIKHYDRWNEYIHQTCTETYACGTDSDGNTEYCTRTYDCSYVQNHPEYWVMVDNVNREREISKAAFDRLLSQWKTPMIFIDMKRNYHTIDGDCQRYDWNGKIEHSVSVTLTGSYTNKIQATNSIFNLEKITKKEAEYFGLFEYPKMNGYYQNNILGINYNENEINHMNFVNGYLGKSCQFRVYLLAFYDKPQDISFKQRSYWKGSNKNEFIICVGLDSISNNLLWVHSFSWSDDKILEIMIDEYIFSRKDMELNIVDLSKVLLDYVPKYWKLKEFKDFDYLKPTLTQKQLMWLSIILIIINIGISIGILLYNKEQHNYKW